MNILLSSELQLRRLMPLSELQYSLSSLSELKVVQLKELCKALGLTMLGKKQDLIDRVSQMAHVWHSRHEVVKLLALRTMTLKLFNFQPVPDFRTLCQALTNGNYEVTPERSEPAFRARQTALNASNPPFGFLGSKTAALPNSYNGPALMFPSTVFYTIRKQMKGFPQIMVASKGRNELRTEVVLSKSDADLLRTSSSAKLYMFGGLASDRSLNGVTVQFPPVEIYVNGVHTRQYIRGLRGQKGTCRPADLTPYIPASNKIRLSLTYLDAPENYVMVVYMVETHSPQTLVDRIAETTEHILAASTRESIAHDFISSLDDDLVIATSSISLRCPLTYARMNYPTRSIECDHIQCFDGLSFLTMQERIPTWICPVCLKQIGQRSLAISDYLVEILRDTSEDTESVNLNPDGSWEAVSEDTKMRTESPQVAVKTEPSADIDNSIEIIELDSDSEDEPMGNNPGTQQSPATQQPLHAEANGISVRKENDNVPLTTSTQPEIPPPLVRSQEADEDMHLSAIEELLNRELTLENHEQADISMSSKHGADDSDDEPLRNVARKRRHMNEGPVMEVIEIEDTPLPETMQEEVMPVPQSVALGNSLIQKIGNQFSRSPSPTQRTSLPSQFTGVTNERLLSETIGLQNHESSLAVPARQAQHSEIHANGNKTDSNNVEAMPLASPEQPGESAIEEAATIPDDSSEVPTSAINDVIINHARGSGLNSDSHSTSRAAEAVASSAGSQNGAVSSSTNGGIVTAAGDSPDPSNSLAQGRLSNEVYRNGETGGVSNTSSGSSISSSKPSAAPAAANEPVAASAPVGPLGLGTSARPVAFPKRPLYRDEVRRLIDLISSYQQQMRPESFSSPNSDGASNRHSPAAHSPFMGLFRIPDHTYNSERAQQPTIGATGPLPVQRGVSRDEPADSFSPVPTEITRTGSNTTNVSNGSQGLVTASSNNLATPRFSRSVFLPSESSQHAETFHTTTAELDNADDVDDGDVTATPGPKKLGNNSLNTPTSALDNQIQQIHIETPVKNSSDKVRLGTQQNQMSATNI